MKLAAMEDSITLWKLKMIKDSIMEVPNNGRNSTVEVASIEIATMEDSIIWKLETIQDSIMDGRNSTMENSIMEIATIEIATMEDSVAWKLETIEDSIMEISNGGSCNDGKFNYRSCNDLIMSRSHFGQNYHRVRNAIVE